MMKRYQRSVALGIAVAVTIGAFWFAARRPQSAPTNVLIITLDTTRADRLSPYGLMDVPMPNLERLAREGVLFDQATSVAPLTLPSHCSLFTGLFPPRHRVRDNADQALAEEHTTLAELLHQRGFRTAAFVGSTVLGRDRGLAQGFDHYSGVDGNGGDQPDERQRRSDEVIAEAIGWLEGVAEPRFFLWAHLYDPHRPYDPPEPYGSKYDPYIGEIAFVDSQIGRLLRALEGRDLLDRTIVIVAGDHGESLGEHGERDHGIFVYESVLRVPLMIRAPGMAPRRIREIVRLIDVMPTVLDLLGLPNTAVDGVSLADVMTGRREGLDLDAYSESLYPERLGWSSLRALRAGRFKLIDAPRPELYDLATDPFEERNIYGERRALAQELKARLDALGSGPLAPDAAKGGTVMPGLEQRLAAQGYVASETREPSVDGKRRPDPKDCIGSYTARLDLHGDTKSLKSEDCR